MRQVLINAFDSFVICSFAIFLCVGCGSGGGSAQNQILPPESIARIKSLEEELAATKASLKDESKRADDAQKLLEAAPPVPPPGGSDELQSQIDKLATQMSELKSDLTIERQNSQKLQGQISTIESEKKSVEGQLIALQQMFDKMKSEGSMFVAGLKQQVKDLQGMLKAEQEQKAEALAASKQTEEELKKWKNVILPMAKPDRKIVKGTLETFQKAKNKEILVGFFPGKCAEAVRILKDVGLIVDEVDEDDELISCRWSRPLTDEALNKLENSRDILIYVEANQDIVNEQSGFLIHEGVARLSGSGSSPVGRSAADDPDDPATIRIPSDEKHNQQWGLAMIGAPEAWTTIQNSSKVVAVIDSGVDYNHPDLRKNIWKNPKYNPKIDIDSLEPDRAAMIAKAMGGPHGYDAAKITIDPIPKEDADSNDLILAHGTHVAGIIGAAGDNEIGGAGVCWGVQIMVVRTGSDSKTLARAIWWARDHGANIINISMATERHNETVMRALRTATEKGILVVCAAGNAVGNDQMNLDQQFVFPASYGEEFTIDGKVIEPFPTDSIISVAAINRDGALARYSNFGRRFVDIAAPGGLGARDLNDATYKNLSSDEDILSTIRGDEYASFYGTSQAAPFVAGAAALVWSHPDYADYSAVRIKELLIEKARTVSSLAGKCRSEGVLNIRFLAAPVPSTPDPPATADPPAGDNSQFTNISIPVAKIPPPPVEIASTANDIFGAGLHYFWDEDYEEAIECFDEAIRWDPGRATYLFFRAFAQARLGNLDQATLDLRLALRRDTRRPATDLAKYMERLQGKDRLHFERMRLSYRLGSTLPNDDVLWTHWPKEQLVQDMVAIFTKKP